MSVPKWLSDAGGSILSSFKTQTATWVVTVVIGLLAVFSSYFTEKVKFALNRADLRTKQYEELAAAVSNYIFAAELNEEFIEHDWTTEKSMSSLVDDYNKSVKELRGKEFIYRSWIQKFWGTNESDQFNCFMKSVRAFDFTMHSLNDEFEAVNITKSKTKIERKRAEEALKVMKPALENMRRQGQALLTALT